ASRTRRKRQALAVWRKPGCHVHSWRRLQRLGVACAVEPEDRLRTLALRAEIDETSVLGEVEQRGRGQPSQTYVFQHGLGGARDGEPVQIKRGRVERTLLHVDQVPAGQIAGEIGVTLNNLLLAGSEREHADFSVVGAPTGGESCEQD